MRRYANAPKPVAILHDGHRAIHGTDQIDWPDAEASRGSVRLRPGHVRILFDRVQAEGTEDMRVVISQ